MATEIEKLNAKMDLLRQDIEQVRRHTKAEQASMTQLISGERGLVKSLNTVEDLLDDMAKKMVKFETKQSINSLIFGMIGSGFVTLIGALVFYYITTKK